MAGRLLTTLTLALAALGVSGLPESSKSEGFYIGVPIANPDVQNGIPHKYIVVYNNTFSDDAIGAHEATVIKTIAKRNRGKRSPFTGKLLSTSVKSFQVGAWRAMSLEADDLMVNELYNANEVSYIEQDAYINVNARQIQGASTNGLARISHSKAGSRGYIFDSSAGEGITAYVVDTGIRVTHSEFEGRATFAANFVNDVVRSDSFDMFRGTAVAHIISLGHR
jgi:subtilisin family serine protease